MKNLEEVEFTCPNCGVHWTEWQDPDDDWFKLATNQTLCPNCGRITMQRILSELNENNN